MRKPLAVSDQERLKQVCSAKEARYSLKISDLATIGVVLSRWRTTRAMIILRGFLRGIVQN